jgi:prophage regulatory protein
MAATESPHRLLREKEVHHLTGLSRTQRRRLELTGEFPSRVRLSRRAFGWVEGDTGLDCGSSFCSRFGAEGPLCIM